MKILIETRILLTKFNYNFTIHFVTAHPKHMELPHVHSGQHAFVQTEQVERTTTPSM